MYVILSGAGFSYKDGPLEVRVGVRIGFAATTASAADEGRRTRHSRREPTASGREPDARSGERRYAVPLVPVGQQPAATRVLLVHAAGLTIVPPASQVLTAPPGLARFAWLAIVPTIADPR